jgi:adenylate cyclase class 2
MAETQSSGAVETEIKARLTDRAAFEDALRALGFRLCTPETLERNILFDTPDGQLRGRRQILRIRRYGAMWKLTHKAPAPSAVTAHKTRMELETTVENGETLAAIFRHLGLEPVFVYEKRRSEWTDGRGQVVVDATPIGDYAELEGEHGWIDETAARLGIAPEHYVTKSYGQIFLEWKQANRHAANNMTFAEIDGHAAN